MKIKKAWKYGNAIKLAKKALSSARSMNSQMTILRQCMSDSDTSPHLIGMTGVQTIAVSRLCEAIIYSESSPDEAWKRLYSVWRINELCWCTYLQNARHLSELYPEKGKASRLPIGNIECIWFNWICMTIAFSASIGEFATSDWLATECIGFMSSRPTYVAKNAWSVGPVEQFIMRIYMLWRKIPNVYYNDDILELSVFGRLISNIHNPERIPDLVNELCEIHCYKALNVNKADNDLVFGLNIAPYDVYPAEILFYLKMLRETFNIDIRSEHPLLNSPMAMCPTPCPKMENDPEYDEVYGACKNLFPQLHLPSNPTSWHPRK